MNQRSVVDVQTFLNEHPFSGFQWVIFALCFVIVLLDGFDTAAIGYIAPSLIKEWGVDRPALGPVLSAALFGLAVGALGSGPLSDRLGRRVLLVGSVLVFGVACLASAFSDEPGPADGTSLRDRPGPGCGDAQRGDDDERVLPRQPARHADQRDVLRLPAGRRVRRLPGGLDDSAVRLAQRADAGRRRALGAGGADVAVLPESVRYMVAKGPRGRKDPRGAAPHLQCSRSATSFVMTELAAHSATTKSGLALVLSRPFIVGSVMLWMAYFMGLVIFYALINWMPILFKDAGIDPSTATLISALFPLGGVGAVVFGVLMDRFNPNRIIAVGYALTAVAVFGIGQAIGSVGMLVAVVFVAGILMNTAQSSMPALAAPFYPTQGRATGVAWMLGIGRFGGIAGSFLVAELTRRTVALNDIFSIVAVAGIVAALALLVKQVVNPQQAATAGPGMEIVGH